MMRKFIYSVGVAFVVSGCAAENDGSMLMDETPVFSFLKDIAKIAVKSTDLEARDLGSVVPIVNGQVVSVAQVTEVMPKVYGRSKKFWIPGLGLLGIQVDYEIRFGYRGRYSGTGNWLVGVNFQPMRVQHTAITSGASVDVKSAQPMNVGTAVNPIISQSISLNWTQEESLLPDQARTDTLVIFSDQGNVVETILDFPCDGFACP